MKQRGWFPVDQHFSPGVLVLFLNNPENSELGRSLHMGVGRKILMAWSTENEELENTAQKVKEYFVPFFDC